jgi:ribose 5-phosphate isomerase B
MNIVVASDHAGFEYKTAIITFLKERKHIIEDCGTYSAEPVDYPVFIRRAAEEVSRRRAERGIVIGGTGNGEAITANRFRGVRCTLCWNKKTVQFARRHNDANMLALGQWLVPLHNALKLVELWLAVPFDGGRHERRIKLIDEDTSLL